MALGVSLLYLFILSLSFIAGWTPLHLILKTSYKFSYNYHLRPSTERHMTEVYISVFFHRQLFVFLKFNFISELGSAKPLQCLKFNFKDNLSMISSPHCIYKECKNCGGKGALPMSAVIYEMLSILRFCIFMTMGSGEVLWECKVQFPHLIDQYFYPV